MRCCRVVIPFRDCGDRLHVQNLGRVVQQWRGYGLQVLVVDDGREGDASFSRSAAYNRAADVDADVIVYAEPDTLVPASQVRKAIAMAAARPGMVVPFRLARSIPPAASNLVRLHRQEPADCAVREEVDETGIGAVSVLSRATLQAVGQWDECFTDSWFDDAAMEHAFSLCAGPVRSVDGPAHRLHHAPLCVGALGAEARMASMADARRLQLYRDAADAGRIRELTAGAW